MRDTLRAFLTNLLAVLVGVRPDVAEAVQQQRAVTGDTHSRKACPPMCFCDRCYRETHYTLAGRFWRAGLKDLAASSLIAASGNGTARVVEEVEHE